MGMYFGRSVVVRRWTTSLASSVCLLITSAAVCSAENAGAVRAQAQCGETQTSFRNRLSPESIVPIDLRQTINRDIVGGLAKSGDTAVALMRTSSGWRGYFYDFQAGRFMEATLQKPRDLTDFTNAQCVDICEVNSGPLENLLSWAYRFRGGMPAEYFAADAKLKAGLKAMPGQSYSVTGDIYAQNGVGGGWVGVSLVEMRGCQGAQDVLWVGHPYKAWSLDTTRNTLIVDDRSARGRTPVRSSLSLTRNRNQFVAEVDQLGKYASDMLKYQQSLPAMYHRVFPGELEAATRVSGRLGSYRSQGGF